MSSFSNPHYMYLFDLKNGKQKLAYGESPEDALEILRIRLTDDEMDEIVCRYVTSRYRSAIFRSTWTTWDEDCLALLGRSVPCRQKRSKRCCSAGGRRDFEGSSQPGRRQRRIGSIR